MLLSAVALSKDNGGKGGGGRGVMQLLVRGRYIQGLQSFRKLFALVAWCSLFSKFSTSSSISHNSTLKNGVQNG